MMKHRAQNSMSPGQTTCNAHDDTQLSIDHITRSDSTPLSTNSANAESQVTKDHILKSNSTPPPTDSAHTETKVTYINPILDKTVSIK